MGELIRKEDALEYHSSGRPGKIAVIATKPTVTQRDLSMAYSPGVAEPCLAIEKDPFLVNAYTSKANLVAVISNGTAVLGLGNIGPLASKPVMEGKGVLFKVFADIDVFDLEVNATEIDHFCSVVKALEPTFGGINLEDIKAPECFEIEKRLKAEMNIPVMHDDQHGTAIIVGAALLNASEITNKNLADLKIVVSGAGASAISCIRILVALGCQPSNFMVFDSKGSVSRDRDDLDIYKQEFASNVHYESLEQAFVGADVFIGLSKGGIVSQDMIRSMAAEPIVFALANPNPEIDYEDAVAAREDIIMATGRSDNPNQVNNVLGFPYLFRGALDVRATAINEEMKLAAVRALADLTKKPVPDLVAKTYKQPNMRFGKQYIIPTPVDPRLITAVAPAVARAAMESGVAQQDITDWDVYNEELMKRLGQGGDRLSRIIINRAKKEPKRVVFAEGDNINILKAAQILKDEKIAHPILLGNVDRIKSIIQGLNIDLSDATILDPLTEPALVHKYAEQLYLSRQRKGMTVAESLQHIRSRNFFAAAMLEEGTADALITGITRKYNTSILPIIQTIGRANQVRTAAGLYIVLTAKGPLFLADTTININPNVDDIVAITELTVKEILKLDIVPKIALLSYSNFGSAYGPVQEKMAAATKLLKHKYPDWILDGDIQANFALNTELRNEYFPFSHLQNHQVNTLIFPDLTSANISYKLLQEATGAEIIGPLLLGMNKPAHVLQTGAGVREIVSLTAMAVIDAQH